jgi:hypothetical protein
LFSNYPAISLKKQIAGYGSPAGKATGKDNNVNLEKEE